MSNNEIAKKENSEIIQKLVLDGDLSKMTGQQKVIYYNQFCESLGLNPLTQPFQLIKFQGKERLYAAKDCTEQLRKIHGVSITDISTTSINDVFIVTAKALDKQGKTDCSTGAVNIKGLSGDNLANALMKAETKAKRRVTLSICGLGILDETETDTMKGATVEPLKTEDAKEDSYSVVTDESDINKEDSKNKGSMYNHKGIGTDDKPLISNIQFTKLMERVKSGDKQAFWKARDAFSFESTQKQLLQTEYDTIKETL